MSRNTTGFVWLDLTRHCHNRSGPEGTHGGNSRLSA
ncbi:hypothetical protein a10_08914 [Streptomyces acidiscabies]|nr:hypothetical protein a10_08914 [Streptomyces acidiscabies]GAV41646.1 hypothetical protein Saa2_04554 [Streptomyces acidiscabies]